MALQTALDSLKQAKASPTPAPAPAPAPTKDDKDKKKEKRCRNYEAWQLENKDGKKTCQKERVVDGEKTKVTFYWCSHHNDNKGMWVRHKPEDCKSKQAKDKAAAAGKPNLVAKQVTLSGEESD